MIFFIHNTIKKSKKNEKKEKKRKVTNLLKPQNQCILFISKVQKKQKALAYY